MSQAPGKKKKAVKPATSAEPPKKPEDPKKPEGAAPPAGNQKPVTPSKPVGKPVSIIQLKAMAWDCISNIETNQKTLNTLNQQIRLMSQRPRS